MHHNIDNQFDLAQQLYSHAKDVNVLKKALDSALLKIACTEFEVLLKLAIVAERHDADSLTHIHRTGYMAELLCMLLKQPPEFCFMMRLATPMHDIGKIGISDDILQNYDEYDDTVLSIMHQHPVIGAKILDITDQTLFQLAAKIALYHHERYDGSGYPYGLTAENIPFVGRIVAIVDFYDAITMNRNDRKAVSNHEAIKMLENQKGIRFDPSIVDVLITHQQKFIDLKTKVDHSVINFDNLIFVDLVRQVI